MNKHWDFALFRIFTALIFIYAGFKHLFHADKIFKRVQQCSLYKWAPSETLFTILVPASGLVMIVAAFFLIAGKFQKSAAAVLLFVLAGITLTIQLEDLADLGPFFKNVAIAGSLLFIYKNNHYAFKKI
jgi:putative oxidoreductase